MRRYLPLLLLSFLLVVLFFGGTFIASQAGKQNPDNIKTIVIYTTAPVEQVTALTQEYEKTATERILVVPLTAADLLTRSKAEAASPKADVILTGADILEAAKTAGLLTAYASEHTDIIPERFCETDNMWTGVWYDPIVFAANTDYLKKLPRALGKWSDLAEPGDARLAITDFLAAEASSNLLYSMASAQGEEQTLAYLAKLHPRVVQYAKFLSTPSRMVGLGEADIAVTIQSEAFRYVKDDFPLQVILPADGTAFQLTGVAMVRGAAHAPEAAKFIDWLTTDQAQGILITNKFFLVPTNPESKHAKIFNTKDIKLFEPKTPLTPAQKAKLLDKWVQTVRLSPR